MPSPTRSGAPPRRLVLVLAVVLAGCSTAVGTPEESAPPSPPATTPPPALGPVGTTPGTYEYRDGGLTAVLELHGNAGTLQVTNETGRRLGRPGLYVLRADDGREVRGRVVGAAPLGSGEAREFQVRFPADLDVADIGLVVLVVGGEAYGAFIPR